jgi:hypothetical protein
LLASGPPAAARDALARIGDPTFEDMDLASTLDLIAAELDAGRGEAAGGAVPAGAKANDNKNADGKKNQYPPATLFLITDLQRANFFPRGEAARGEHAGDTASRAGANGNNANANNTASAPAGPAVAPGSSSALQAAAAALASRNVHIRILDIGSGGDGPVENIGIQNVYVSDDIAATGVPLELRVSVRNFGATARANVVVQATVDGNRESPQTIDTLPAGAVHEVLFSLMFRDPGDHAVEVFLDEDKLTVDDKRAFSITTRPPVRVLLVDGSPDPEPEIASAGMLALALAPAEEATMSSPFRLVENAPIDRTKFSAQPELLEQSDVALFVNVEGFSEDQVSRIRDFCEAGGCVLFVMGDRVDPASYSSRLRTGSDPKLWLFPGAITGVREIPSREHPPWRIATIEDPVPVYLRFFEPPERRVLLTEMPVYRFQGVDVGEQDVAAGARVLARYNDGELSPFLITKEIGRGRVAVITTALDSNPDRRWSRIADLPKTFLPLTFDLLHGLVSGTRNKRNVTIGETLRAEVRGAPRQASLTDPAGRIERLDSEKPKRLGADRYLLESTQPVERPGMYQLEVESAVGVGNVQTQQMRFAAAVDPEEGDLARVSASSVASALPGIDVRAAQGLDEEAAPSGQGPTNEIWKPLIAAALGILLLESVLATWFGRRRG